MRISYFGLMLVFYFIACKNSDEAKSGASINESVVKSTGKTTVDLVDDKRETYLASKLFKEVKFIPLETKAQSLLAEINDVLFYNDTYIFFDVRQKCLLGFGTEGKFRFKICPSGKGPLEVNFITDYTINKTNNLLEVFDLTLRKIVSYNLEGVPQKEKRFNYFFREASCTSKGDYIIYAPDTQNETDKNKISPGAFVVDSLGNFKHSFFTNRLSSQYVQPMNCLSGFGDTITLVSNYSKDIFFINNDEITIPFNADYQNDWVQGLIMAGGMGRLINFVYAKDLNTLKSYSVFLDLVSKKEYHFEYLANDLFVIPVVIPRFFKNSETLIALINPEEKEQYLKILNSDKLPDNVDKKLLNELKTLLSGMKTDDNPLMILLTLK